MGTTQKNIIRNKNVIKNKKINNKFGLPKKSGKFPNNKSGDNK